MQLYYFSPPYYSTLTLRTVLFLGSSVLWSLIAGLLKIGLIETVLGSSLVDLAVLWMAAVSFFEVFWNFYVFVTFWTLVTKYSLCGTTSTGLTYFYSATSYYLTLSKNNYSGDIRNLLSNWSVLASKLWRRGGKFYFYRICSILIFSYFWYNYY